MSRREFPAKVRVAAYKRCNGHCEKCTAPLSPGKFSYDHIVADALGGEPVLENCQVLCDACHGIKTAEHDTPRAAKQKRQERAHLGAKPEPAKPIQSAPFPITKGRKQNPMPGLPPRALYAEVE